MLHALLALGVAGGDLKLFQCVFLCRQVGGFSHYFNVSLCFVSDILVLICCREFFFFFLCPFGVLNASFRCFFLLLDLGIFALISYMNSLCLQSLILPPFLVMWIRSWFDFLIIFQSFWVL